MPDDAAQPAPAASPSTALARVQREITPVQDVIPIFDTARFEHMQRIGNVLAMASIFPKHLRGRTEGRGEQAQFVAFPKEQVVANAIVVVNQAERWNVDPFALAQCTYATPEGKIGYEGKMIAAVVQARAKVRFHYQWSGEGLERKIIISDQPWDEDGRLPHGARTVEGTVGQWATYRATWANRQKTGEVMKDNWMQQPDIQLVYRGSRVWANIYEPGIVVGVLSDDELDALEDRREVVAAPVREGAPRLTAGFGDDTDQTFRGQASTAAGEAPKPDAQAEGGDHVQDAEFEDAGEEVVDDGGEGEPAETQPSPTQPSENTTVEPQTSTSENSTTTSPSAPEPDEETLRQQHEDAMALAYDLGREAANHGLEASAPEGMNADAAERWLDGHRERCEELAEEEGDEDDGPTTATAGEIYLIVGEGYDERGRRVSYKDGVPYSTVTEKGAAKLPLHNHHAPTIAAEPEPKQADPEPKKEEPKAPEAEKPATPKQSDPFDECNERILAASGWLGIKQHIRTLTKTDAWKGADDEGKRMVRVAAWERFVELRDAGEDKSDPAGDISLFRLWAEFGAKTKAEVDGLFKSLFRSQAYREASEGDKKGIADLIERIKAGLPDQ